MCPHLPAWLAMAWFDRPAASIASTSSSRSVSCSTRPGTTPVANRPGVGMAGPESNARWSRARQPSGASAVACPARWAVISWPSSAAIGFPSSMMIRT